MEVWKHDDCEWVCHSYSSVTVCNSLESSGECMYLLSKRDLIIKGTHFLCMISGGDWALQRSGAVFLEGTESTQIRNCVFERIDGNALMISGYNRYAQVTQRYFKLYYSVLLDLFWLVFVILVSFRGLETVQLRLGEKLTVHDINMGSLLYTLWSTLCHHHSPQHCFLLSLFNECLTVSHAFSLFFCHQNWAMVDWMESMELTETNRVSTRSLTITQTEQYYFVFVLFITFFFFYCVCLLRLF